MSDKIYDIEQNGKPKLKEIIKILSKARANASARSTDLMNNTSTKNIVPTHLLGKLYESLNHRLSRIRETPGLTDKLVKTDPAYAAIWFLDYENLVKEVLTLGDREPELEAMAFGIPTLYTITLKLPFTLSYKIYDIEQNGKPKLEEIIKIISKARAMASARSTDMAYNTSTKNIISTQLTFPVNPVLTMATPSAATPVAPASPTTIAHSCSSEADLC
jgi:hypothetical protein